MPRALIASIVRRPDGEGSVSACRSSARSSAMDGTPIVTGPEKGLRYRSCSNRPEMRRCG
jgi:hypothetical protein